MYKILVTMERKTMDYDWLCAVKINLQNTINRENNDGFTDEAHGYVRQQWNKWIGRDCNWE